VCAVGALGGAYTLSDGIIVGPSECDTGSLVDLLDGVMAGNAEPMVAEMGGKTFTPGTYSSPTMTITTTVTLDGLNQANPEFIFQSDSTLAIAASIHVILINGAKAENILWAVSAAATVGAQTVLEGSVLAGAAITLGAGTHVNGCVLAVAAVSIGAGSSIMIV
jgi:hypothetical protein